MPDLRVLTFQEDNRKARPCEDYCIALLQRGIFAIADGVSRSHKEGDRYPELSSQIAAEQFCRVTAYGLEQYMRIEEVFDHANKAIAALNHAHRIIPGSVDFLYQDYLSCVGIVGSFSGMEGCPNTFVYGYMGDCGMLLYDADFFPVFMTQDPVGVLERFREGWGFSKEEKAILWRREFRNRNARIMTYGALTGEPSALLHLKCGYIDIRPGDTALLFSDGVYPFVFDRRFRVAVDAILREDWREEKKRWELAECMMVIEKDLCARGVKNLNDDRTLIAFQLAY